MRNTLKSADAALSNQVEELASRFGYAPETEAYLYFLCGGEKALVDVKRNRRSRTAAPLTHIKGLDPVKFPHLSQDPSYNVPYADGYNTSLDFILDHLKG